MDCKPQAIKPSAMLDELAVVLGRAREGGRGRREGEKVPPATFAEKVNEGQGRPVSVLVT